MGEYDIKCQTNIIQRSYLNYHFFKQRYLSQGLLTNVCDGFIFRQLTQYSGLWAIHVITYLLIYSVEFCYGHSFAQISVYICYSKTPTFMYYLSIGHLNEQKKLITTRIYLVRSNLFCFNIKLSRYSNRLKPHKN